MPLFSQHTKYANLLASLQGMRRVFVAFSGGADSALLLYAAQQALGENVVAVTMVTPYTPKAETAGAMELAKTLRVRHQIVTRPLPEIIRENPPDRCYLCKQALFGEITNLAKEQGVSHILDGSNLDDQSDYRPGRRAVTELGIRSPLLDAALTKRDIRDISREIGLSTWNLPAGACLLTRIPHGTCIKEDELARIDDGESYLRSLGFPAVRLRSHGDLACIELPPDVITDCLTPALRESIVHQLRLLGYCRVAIDLAGYRMGNLNKPGITHTGEGKQQ